MEKGIVFNIQNFSIHDGPGIRTVVFLKGCPLRCKWCANPESQKATLEMGWTKGECIGCGNCIQKLRCLHTRFNDSVLLWDSNQPVDRDYAKVCPSQAFHVIGKVMDSDEVIKEAGKDRAFFDTSGGGITLSGGEPLMQGEFAIEILKKAKQEGLHTCIETCGCVPGEVFEKAAAYLDYLIMDIKLINEAKHIQSTGGSNRQILENLTRVRKKYPYLPIKVRTPLIPGVNNTREDIQEIIEFLKDKAVEYELLKYHRLGLPKYDSLNRLYPMGDTDLAPNEYELMKEFAAKLMTKEFDNGEGI